MATRKQAGSYVESSVRVLKGLEPVKERPGMYTLTCDPLHIIQEVVDNSSDEVLAGFGSKIEVWLHPDNSVTVEDNGRGIPVGQHRQRSSRWCSWSLRHCTRAASLIKRQAARTRFQAVFMVSAFR